MPLADLLERTRCSARRAGDQAWNDRDRRHLARPSPTVSSSFTSRTFAGLRVSGERRGERPEGTTLDRIDADGN